VETEGTAVDVISCHLKSKLLSFPGGRFNPKDEGERAQFAVYALNRRAAEAAAVRAYATRLLAGDGQHRAVVVAGDLNDEPEAATTQLLHGPPGSEIGTGAFDHPDSGDGQRLWNLAPLIPEDQRFSRVYRGRGELIDHLLVSHVLVKAVRTVTTGEIELPSITDQPGEREDGAGSDHRPVVGCLQPRVVLQPTPGADVATSQQPTLPVYPFGEPGREIVIHQGDIERLSASEEELARSRQP
jgi:hypothetical protein